MSELISIVIPYFQREPGILARALNSVVSQEVPEGWAVEVVIVDDASPHPARAEINDIDAPSGFDIRIIAQSNRGPAGARNRALDELRSSSTLIAFLDSDDVWPAGHLFRAIQAMRSGFDFYFTDNRRVPYHNSYIQECTVETKRQIASAPKTGNVLVLQAEQFVGLVLEEFPAQASTIVYRRDIAPDLRFNEGLNCAGEDLLFFSTLASKSGSIGFDPSSSVDCGGGMNIYFGNFSWDSPKALDIRVDKVLAQRLVRNSVRLSDWAKTRSDIVIARYRQDLGFHVARMLLKRPSRIFKPIGRMIKTDSIAALVLPLDTLRGMLTLVKAKIG